MEVSALLARMQMAAEEAAARAEEEAKTFLGPMPPDVIAEAEQAGADKPTAEVLRICRCSTVATPGGLRRPMHQSPSSHEFVVPLHSPAGGCGYSPPSCYKLKRSAHFLLALLEWTPLNSADG
jgi:hypothetical protein